MRKVLFIDRDGTIIKESPPDYQIDSFLKLEFYPDVFRYLRKIAGLDYDLVMVTNQDGLGTDVYPKESFNEIQNFILKALANEGVVFKNIHIDRSFPADNLDTRKPRTGMLKEYLNNRNYDISGSFVIGDRITDVQLAKNLECKAIWLKTNEELGLAEVEDGHESLQECIELETTSWKKIYEFLRCEQRQVVHERNTKETRIRIVLDLDGPGKTNINTGVSFFDHMLEQIGKHAGIDLEIETKGDLHIDEHHTIEDTAIALGEALAKALGNKLGIDRYGFCLPMDDCLAQVALDFGGRSWLVWDAEFKREKIGEMPTEMFYHFFKSFSDAAKCNLNIKAEGTNEHHKIESIFKAFAKAIKLAIKRDVNSSELPSTKGLL